MRAVDELRVKIFADGADKAGMLDMYAKPYIKGFTTNPTLMRKAGIDDFEAFARDILHSIADRPISFEVFADDFDEMGRQARWITTWGPNVYVKIPVTNTNGESAAGIIRALSADGIKLNITAMMTVDQVRDVCAALNAKTPACLSIFAGRIADTGRDPVPLMVEALQVIAQYPRFELIWASPREVLNVIQADAIGCHVITVTLDLLKKLPSIGKGLDQFSLETVQMFYSDAVAAHLSI